MDSWGKLTAQTEPQASSWGRGRKLEKPVGVGTRLGGGLLEAQGLFPWLRHTPLTEPFLLLTL